MNFKIIIFLLVIALFTSGCLSIVENDSSNEEIDRNNKIENSENKNMEDSKNNYPPQVFYPGNKQSNNRIKVEKYTNFSENILNNKTHRYVMVDKSFNQIQVIIEYKGDKNINKTEKINIKNPSSEKVTKDYPQTEISESGELLYYKIDNPSPGEWEVKTNSSTEIESIKKYSPYNAELNTNYSYKKEIQYQ